MKTARPARAKARRMWAVQWADELAIYQTRLQAKRAIQQAVDMEGGLATYHPVAVLSLAPEDVEAMVEKAAKACFEVGFASGEVWEDAAPMMRIAARIEAEAAFQSVLGLLAAHAGKEGKNR